MKTVHAIYANGVFRPTVQVELPDLSEVEFEPRAVEPAGTATPMSATAYAVLSERYASGDAEVAARHDEHQP
jgi:predicted DNA-binding antitoxin AbrB/MazE fold protein